MSIFGSMATAVLGLSAQSRALSHISDNIANAQTTGYKRVDSSFQTLVLESNTRLHASGGVITRPKFQNSVQGGLVQVQSTTNMAIQGDGFFTVSRPPATGETDTGTAAIGRNDIFYTRVGDFELDKDRYLTNSAGFRLNGFVEDVDTEVVNTFGGIEPIQITNTLDKPVPTTGIDLVANLPATPKPGDIAPTTTINIFDNLGRPQELTLKWRQQAEDDWRLIIDAPGSLATTQPMGPGFAGEEPTASPGAVTQSRESRKQVNTITFGSDTNYIQVGELYTLTIDGISFSQAVTTDNVGTLVNFDGVADALAAKVNGAVPPVGVNATIATGGKLVLTASSAGTGFTTTASVKETVDTTNLVPTSATAQTAAASRAQITTLTFSGPGIDIGDQFTVNVANDSGAPPAGYTKYAITVTAGNYGDLRNINGLVQALADKINASPSSRVIASANSTVLTLTGKTATAAGAFDLTSAVVNGSTIPNQTATIKLPTNVTGVKQRQTISLAGGVGDIGANYQITLKSPTLQNVTATTSQVATTALPQISTATFTAVGTLTVGQEYKVTVDGTNYAVLITEDNIDTVADIDGVIALLVGKINNDFGTAVSASAGATGSGAMLLTGKYVDDEFTVAMPTLTPFNQLFELPIDPDTGLAGTTGDELTIGDIATKLAAQINSSGLPISATVAGGTLTLTATSDEISFVSETDTVAGTTPGHARLQFGGETPAGTDVPAGTIRSIEIVGAGGTATAPTATDEGDDAILTFTVDYGAGPQIINLALGEFHRANGVTQYAGDTVNVSSIQQNGSPRGQFKNVEVDDNGDVIVNFDNGRSRTVAKVPLTFFNNPNALQRESGGVFSQTSESGPPNGPFLAGTNGTGRIVPNSLENSNVDIADEFTKLIVTQRTYSANTRIVTSADEMLQEALNLKR